MGTKIMILLFALLTVAACVFHMTYANDLDADREIKRIMKQQNLRKQKEELLQMRQEAIQLHETMMSLQKTLKRCTNSGTCTGDQVKINSGL